MQSNPPLAVPMAEPDPIPIDVINDLMLAVSDWATHAYPYVGNWLSSFVASRSSGGRLGKLLVLVALAVPGCRLHNCCATVRNPQQGYIGCYALHQWSRELNEKR